jgi:hypothetical protein
VKITHTPGPWSYQMRNNYARIYFHGLSRDDKVLGGDSLCGYCGEANAMLIAAAPNMFEALTHTTKVINNMIHFVEDVLAAASVEMPSELITSAEACSREAREAVENAENVLASLDKTGETL